jgi:phosphatidylglycerophosphate synthase
MASVSCSTKRQITLNPSSIRRFIFTLITGYLAIFGVQQLPYEFENQWLVLIPVLIVVYIITVWLDGLIFKDSAVDLKTEATSGKNKTQASKKGFGK